MRYGSLLLLLSRPNPAPEDAQEARRVVQEGTDWDGLVSAALSHGTAPVVYKNAALPDNILLPSPPARALQTLKGAYHASLAVSARYQHELGELAGRFEKEGMDMVLLKGASYGTELFGDPALYPSEDIDLLIRAGDFWRAAASLKEMGYEPEHGVDEQFVERYRAAAFFAPSRRPVELHLTLGKPRYFAIPDEYWWEGLRDMEIGDGPVYKVLSRERNLMYAVIHLASHGYAPLKFIVVLSEMLALYGQGEGEALDWESLFKDARRFNVHEIMLLTIDLSSRLLRAPVPDEVARRLRDRSFKERIICDMIEKMVLKERPALSRAMFLTTALQHGAVGIVANLLRWAFPPLSEVRQRYNVPPGSKMVYLYYFMNPVLLAIKKRRV